MSFVEYDSKNLIISNFKKTRKIKLDNITDISRFQLYFYRIKIKDDSELIRIFIMPVLGEVLLTFMISKPESIKKLIKKIK